MSEARPRLEVVEGGAGSGESAPAAPLPRRRSRAVVVAWALAGLLALALLAFAQQGRRAEHLEARVTGLTAELAASEAALAAQRSHLDEVRGAVSQLQELVERDPAREPAPQH